MSLYTPTCPPPTQYTCDPCGTEIESGKIRYHGFIKRTYEFVDETDPLEWKTAIDNGDIILIPDVIGQFDGGAPTEIAGRGDSRFNVAGYTFIATIDDLNYAPNRDFYESMKNRIDYDYFFVGEKYVRFANEAVNVQITTPIDISEDVPNKVSALIKWYSKDHPTIVPRATLESVFACFVDV